MTSSRIYGRSGRRRKIYPEQGIAMFHKASLQAVPSEHLPAAHALRSPLPGIAHDLRLDDAGDAKPAWITPLTIEHYNLQMQRVATISESNGRASVFLGAVSAGLIALGFDSTRGASPIGHMIFQVLVLTPLAFLGLVAFGRCLEIAIDDWEFVTRIARLRRTYDQLVPELAPLMSRAVADEGVAGMLSPSASTSRSQRIGPAPVRSRRPARSKPLISVWTKRTRAASMSWTGMRTASAARVPPATRGSSVST